MTSDALIGTLVYVGGLALLGLIVWASLHTPKERSCASKIRTSKRHVWSDWTMMGRVEIYREVDPPKGFMGNRIHFARRCNKCGLPDTMVERDY